MPLYQNSSIYKLVHRNDLDNENIYIGSTTNFRGRKGIHKSNYFNINSKNHNVPIYQYIRNNGGWDNWLMIEIEKFSCNDKRELEIRERYWIEKNKSKLNACIPTRTPKEYRQDNRERLLEQKKQKVKCECGCVVIKREIERHRKSNKHQRLMLNILEK
tara:strand:- start:502 stop:978 length:477 start_codon:yes stop_codon:yes gene_type:complete